MKNKLKLKKEIYIILIFVIILLLSLFLLKMYRFKYNESLKNQDYTTPDNAKVIVHLSTLTDHSVNFFPKPNSFIYYYDEKGEVLKTIKKEEEVLDDFIVQGGELYCISI